MIPLLRDAVWSVDRDVAITQAGTMDSWIAESASDEHYRTLLMASFSVFAVALAAVGVFAVAVRFVVQRSREMGIRMALGARESDLVRTMLRGALATGLAGTALGLVGAFWASRLLSGFLFAVETWDPATYAGVAGLLLLTCLAASAVPARRIARVNPTEVLRAE